MMQLDTLVNAISKLDAWLESMRQKGGYGGPVAHWWQHCMLYTGPGIDWRYEGILAGYHLLYQKTDQLEWRVRLLTAVDDVISAQHDDGTYPASQFEMNPDVLGTPHEAAATLGLLTAYENVRDERMILAAKRNLDHLIGRLWDGYGFNDRPGVRGRVPNKLATLAEAFLTYHAMTGDNQYLPYAEACLKTVISYQVTSGAMRGAIHQYGHLAKEGDGKFFPFYNARCVWALVRGTVLLGNDQYRESAKQIVEFLQSTMNDDGSWPQIVYANGKRTDYPRWVAGAADIMRAYEQVGEPIPERAVNRLLAKQIDNGGFPTAEGFLDFRDVLPVVGWNDKVFRFLIEQLPQNVKVPLSTMRETKVAWGPFTVTENQEKISVVENGQSVFLWYKRDPWTRCTVEAIV